MSAHVQTKKAYAGKFTSTALSTGGHLECGDRSKPLTVDRSNAQPMLKKQAGRGGEGALDSFNMFKPMMEHHSAGRRLADAKSIHTDPFAQDRPHYQPPVKKLIEVQRREVEPHARKHVTSTVKDGQHKEKLITANGMVGQGGKHFQHEQRTSQTTFDKEDPRGKINYAGMSRFKNSAAARQESINIGPISPTSGDSKDYPSVPRPNNGGKKSVAGTPDPSASLAGVLRMEGSKPARSYDYRPPWGTVDTAAPQRTPQPAAGRFQSSPSSNAPWASHGPAATPQSSAAPSSNCTPRVG